ncbi:MAG: sigma-70 family RNA polymerase sigma factor [Pirellulales bacterium]|nr:sigma-70 family RNA polymerase sigma factor [Pirellulales bacterium]
MGGIRAETVTRLWDEHGPALTLYARQWCVAPEDVVQEAFLLLVRQPAAPENPVGWMYRVVRNRALKTLRSSGRKTRHEAVAARRGKLWFKPAAGDRLDAATATELLEGLPLHQREVIVARLWGGLTFEEIAELSELSVSAVFRNYHRGLATLRERLGVSCPKRKISLKN